MKIAFVHPDLGIGGAEKLIVDAATGLQDKGHEIEVFTAHHDPSHCFEATRDGTLKVRVHGDWLPRSTFGGFMVFWAIVRCIWCSFALLFGFKGEFDVIVCDQVSMMIPVLRWTGARVVFYCHFPDLLLSERKSFLKRAYRYAFDYLEESTTAMADAVMVNSKFTGGIVKQTFSRIDLETTVVYPGINFEQYEVQASQEALQEFPDDKQYVVSINRFERKKNLALVLRAFAELTDEARSNSICVLAGGYDPRVTENVEHLKELQELAKELDIESQVKFVPSFSDDQRAAMLEMAACVVYSPSNEHFGIVPLEAMYAGVPVVATNTGGPLETVVDGKTGFHCEPNPAAFATAIQRILDDPSLRQQLSKQATTHVVDVYGYDVFVDRFEAVVKGETETETETKKSK